MGIFGIFILYHFPHFYGDLFHLIVDKHFDFEEAVAEGDSFCHVLDCQLVNVLIETSDIFKKNL
jgi:hypothetical protein